MPELPEAETIAGQLHELLAGKRFDRVVYVLPKLVRGSTRSLRRIIAGSLVERVDRRAKRVVIHLDGGRGLVFNLGMSGHLSVPAVSEPVAKHTHFRAVLAGDKFELRFRDVRQFGGICWFNASEGEVPAALAGFGVEPLDMTTAQFRQIAARRRQIKALLLDQSAIAGIGNIYADESLHRAGIHPLEIAADIDAQRVGRLCQAIKSILRAAIKAQGSTISDYRTPAGALGAYHHRHRVYGRTGQPCKKCGAPIERLIAAGRSSHICPACQAVR